ncbi:MAG: geranylgeranyl reductase family protein [Pseudomonadota bacterium]
MQYFDVIVVGAGPAGTSAARQARRFGLEVAILDKASFPRDKLCGGLVTGRCARALKQIFDLEITPDYFDTHREFEFFHNGEPLGGLCDIPPLHLTMRRDFDARLLDLARAAGAKDLTGQRILSLNLDRDTITLADGQTFVFGCLIGADGVNSQVATALFGRSFDPRKIGFALEIEAPASPSSAAQPIRIDFGAAQWGYGWGFPKRRSTTIGIGGLHRPNPDMKVKLQRYLSELGTGTACKVRGHFLPFGDAAKRPGRGNILLVGDAAGLVDPITGEGIGHAVQSGALAAKSVSRALREGQPGLAARYHYAATRPIRQTIAQARLLRPLIFAPRLQPFFARTFRESNRLKRDYMRLLSGDMEYRDILWRTSRRLPSALWKHLRA